MLTVDVIKNLHDHGLHASIAGLASLVLSSSEFNNIDRSDVGTHRRKFELLSYFGDALYEDEQYFRAKAYFNQALVLWKWLSKVKSKPVSSKSVCSDVEVRFKIYQCNMEIKDFKDAIDVLEGVPLRHRTAKVNMALAKLYQKHGMERSATTCYKEVLRVCPLAVEAATSLLRLGVSIHEVTNLVSVAAGSKGASIPEGIQALLKAQSHMAMGKHAKAIQHLKTVESQHFPNNVDVLTDISLSYAMSGNKVSAMECFDKVHSLEPFYFRGMDTYAALLAETSNVEKLERLTQDLTGISQVKSEPWTVVAYCCAAANKKTKAIYFAQKAHMIDTRNIQALLIKANLLCALSKQQEAIVHFRESIRLVPNQFEAYEGLVDCYLSLDKNREALSVARNCHKTIGALPRTLTLCARVLSEDPDSHDKAQTMAEKAIAQDPSFLPAVYILVEILMKERKFNEAIPLLKKHLENESTSHLYFLLGRCYKETNRVLEGLQQFLRARRLDPHNSKAAEALNEIAAQPSNASVAGELDFGGDQSDMAFSGDNNELDFESDYEIDVSWLQ